MKTYCAITLGPIYKTISQARKTRELWSGSYLFSYLMKQLLSGLELQPQDILLPYTGKVSMVTGEVNLLTDELGAGLFPDRAVWQLPEGQSLAQVEELVNRVTDELISKLIAHLSFTAHKKLVETDARKFFQNYFQVYAISQAFEEKALKKEIVKELFGRLDVLELQMKIVPPELQNYIEQFMNTSSFKAGEHRSFLKQDAGLSAERFESIIEIAATELIPDKPEFYRQMKAADKDDTDDRLMTDLKAKHGSTFRTHHKYIAIVNIDGDFFGDFVAALNDDEYEQFTKALACFSLRAYHLINDYEGQPVYLGGDDALFFAPVRKGAENIFTLLRDIDQAFDAEFEVFVKAGKFIPTLSAGVAIHYYKHPLTESLERSQDLLFGKAKNFEMRNGSKKNAIAIEVQKHSGQTFGAVLKKSADELSAYRLLMKMLEKNINDDVFLNSVIQHLSRHRVLLDEIGEDGNRVKFFITNQFNESIHQQSPYKEFLEALTVFVSAVYTAYPARSMKDPGNSGKSEALTDLRAEALYGSLRLVKFLNRDDNE